MDDTPAPRKLKIDLAELAFAMENTDPETSFFLGLETGDLILLTADTNAEYEALRESIGPVDEAGWPAAFEAALSDWEGADSDTLRDADRVWNGLPNRFVRVPKSESHDGYHDMEEFIDTVANAKLRDRLARAIEGRGAFRRFKDTLLEHEHERQGWFAFLNARQIERAREWLAAEGISTES